MKQNVLVSVIFATYNRCDVIRQVLQQWEKVDKTTKYSYEIICSDDASSDNTVSIIEEFVDKLPITILRNEHGGASRARNAALKIARGEIVIFTGDDIFPTENFINKHYENHLLFGDNVSTLGRIEWHKDIEMNHLMYHISNVGCEQFGFATLPPHSTIDYRFFYTSNISVSRKVLNSLHEYFSLSFDRYGFEDIELGYRIGKAGVTFFYDSDILAYHHHIYDDVDKFCNRQLNAGNQLIVFANLQPKVRKNEFSGIDDFNRVLKEYIKNSEKYSSRGKKILAYVDKMKNRTKILERQIKKCDIKELRAECSALYKFIFQFYMYMGWAKRYQAKKEIDDSVFAEMVFDYICPGIVQYFYQNEKLSYNEADSIMYVERGIQRKISIEIEKPMELRLDPISFPCIIKNFSAYVKNRSIIKKKLKIKRTNSDNENILDFTNQEDPQIYFDCDNLIGKQTIQISMDVYSLANIEKEVEKLVQNEINQNRNYIEPVYEKELINIQITGLDKTKTEKLISRYNDIVKEKFDERVIFSKKSKAFASNYIYKVKNEPLKDSDMVRAVEEIYKNFYGVNINGNVIKLSLLKNNNLEKIKTI